METPGPQRDSQTPASSFQACDPCRSRKIRCDQLLALPIADHESISKCANCQKRGVGQCTYKHELKRRGPQPGAGRGRDSSPTGNGTSGATRGRRRKQSSSSASNLTPPSKVDQNSFHEPTLPILPPSPVTTFSEVITRSSNHPASFLPIRRLSHLSGVQQRFSFNAANPLEAVLPRDLMLQVISLFFHYLYPLIPLVHRPSFEADIEDRREEREGQQEWTALVLVTLAFTVAQLPSVLIPLDKSHSQALIQRCYLEAMKLSQTPFPVPSPYRCCIEYLASTVALMLGSRAASRCHRSVMWSHIMELRMHEESSYVNLEEVERQVRRRIFWVAYNADRTAAAIGGMPVFVQEDDLSSISDPLAIDDTTIFEPSGDCVGLGQTPLMSGFVYTVRLCRYLGDALNKRSQDRCRPPRGVALQMRLNEITALGDQAETLMHDCPRELMLDNGDISSWYELGGLAASVPIRYRDGFLVQATNLYITQHMVAYIIAQYRADLLTVQKLEHREGLSSSEISSIWSSSPSSLSTMTKTAIFAQDGRRLTKTLLKIVKACPIQALAVNSHHIVPKIRCVASALLDMTVDSFDPMGLATWRLPESSRDEAATYLAEFFSVLSKIETACTLPENPEV